MLVIQCGDNTQRGHWLLVDVVETHGLLCLVLGPQLSLLRPFLLLQLESHLYVYLSEPLQHSSMLYCL